MDEDSGEWERNSNLLHESFDFKEVTWTLRCCDVLPLTRRVNYELPSASFPFASATWEMRIRSNCEIHGKSKYIELEIRRLYSQIPEHRVFYKFGHTSSALRICPGMNEIYSDKALFTPNENAWTVTKNMKKSQLIQMMSIVGTNGEIPFNCQMRTKKLDGIDASFQIDSIAFLSDEHQVQEPPDPLENKILCDFKNMFLQEEDHDVIIKVKGKEFKAHRIILKARSPVFASTFRSDMKEKSTGVIDIEDCDPATFSNFLSFLYCGEIENLSTENVFSLLTVADKYDVQDLRVKCVEFMKVNLSVDTFCDTITLAVQHSEADLVKLCTDFFAENLEEIIVTVKWQMFLAENPTESNELLIKALVRNKN